ncbi:MAG: amino acid-binding ACT domain-containing protein [Steroidobacteraceae bacterium]
MKDLAIELANRPGALAEMGEALGAAQVSLEGGGAFAGAAGGVAHFLVADVDRARRALADAGIRVVADREIIAVHLHQEEPGQLGRLTRRMAEAGVNIEVLYSDHAHRLILVVDRPDVARPVAAAWEARRDE